MAFPGAGSGGNFLEQMLGDLLQLMGGAPGGGGGRLELARSLAQGVASGGAPEANPDPAERIRLEELVRIAELHVAELSGLSLTPAGSSLEVVTVGPGGWAWQTVDDWRFLLEAMTSAPAGPGTAADRGTPQRAAAGPGDGPGGPAEVPGLGLADLDDDIEPATSADLLARWMATMGPVLAAVQLASAVGHLAQTALGPYELPIPRPGHRLLVVPGTITRFAADWSLEPDQVRLWVCVRTVAMHGVLSTPHVGERVRTLLVRVVQGMAEEASTLTERLRGLDVTGPDALQRLLGDPEALFDVEASPARRRAGEELSAAVLALVAYVDHVLELTATRLLGGRSAITEAWRRRQVDREDAARSAEAMVGLDLGPVPSERGASFVAGVLERAGEAGLARLWSTPDTLPTPTELDAPGLWLERIDLDTPPA